MSFRSKMKARVLISMDSTENMIIFKAFESAQDSPKAHRGFTLKESESSNVVQVHNLSKQTFGL